jgi:hypothetical protein
MKSKKKLLFCSVMVAIVTVLFVGCASLWDTYNANHPSGSNKYYELLTNLSPLENHYMKMGTKAVESYEVTAPGTIGHFRVWYPVDMKNSGMQYPVIISNNGTGWLAIKYTEWFSHMAARGFVVVGNDEGTSWNGNSAEASLQWILKLNADVHSIFYHRLDIKNIGTIGHSQGGTGVENAITVQPSARMYKCAVMLASTYNGYNAFLKWKADASKIRVPILVLVANDDGLTPIKDYNSLWNALPNNIIKVAGRRTGCGHGDMLVYGDGYVAAWFLWFLKGDISAHEAIKELKTNTSYTQVRMKGI